MSQSGYVRFFEEIGIEDVPLVGGKNASLGEMYPEAVRRRACACRTGSPSPPRPIATCSTQAGAWDLLHAALDGLDPDDVAALARKGKRAREIVYGAGLPDDLADRDSGRLPPAAGGVRARM